jgi:molecular chaperone DnaJ
MNPYEILGVDRNANADEIKKAYRKLSKEHHPDKGGNEDKFKDVAAAYDILSDPQKKQNYDMFGDAKGNPDPFAGFGGGFNPFGGFDDFISQMMGGGRRQPQQRKGSNVGVHVQMSLIDILKGATKRVNYTKQDKCDSCDGKGGQDVSICNTCNGAGHVTQVMRTPAGIMQQVGVCPNCSGEGKSIKTPCNKCHGSGTMTKNETVNVTISAGSYNGQQLPLNGAGNYVRDGVPGDLIIIIDEVPDANFKREITPDGQMTVNLKHEIWISISEAVLGTSKIIKAPLGDLSFNIEAGCPSGKSYKFAGKGIPHADGKNLGNLIVTVNVKIPTKVTDETRALFEELKKYD